MAHIYMQFDFGKDEEKAQAARHKIETWKQAFRLDKKLLYKFERIGDGTAAATDKPVDAKPSLAKAEKTKGKDKPKAKGKEETTAKPPAQPNSNEQVKLLLRLAFSSHEKLSEQRWVQRIPTEEPFHSASPVVLKPGDTLFSETEQQFESLA